MKLGMRQSERQQAVRDRDTGAGGKVIVRPRAPVTCSASRCRASVNEGQLFCHRHWYSLPQALRKSIWAAFRHRRAQSYGALVQRAVDIIDQRGAA